MVELGRFSTLVAAVGLAGIAATGAALSADMPVKVKAPPPPAVYDWSGIYIGFSAGGMWTDVNRHLFNAPLEFSTNTSDAIVDAHAGAQVQWGSWVLGIEAGLTHCFRECRAVTALPPNPAAGFDSTTYHEHKVTDLFTVGPRLGYAWDRWMIYGTGGYANATLKGAVCAPGALGLTCGGPGSGQSRNDGWFAGGGFEYMVHKGALVDVLLGAEYQHWDVRSTRAFCFGGPACGSIFDYDLGAKGDIVRARLTIKTQGWGWAGPAPAVVAKN